MGEYTFLFPVVVIIVLAVVFIFCREFFCWYLKMTKQVEVLTEIRDTLIEMNDNTKKKDYEHNIALKMSTRGDKGPKGKEVW
jgi:hypothetical protein